VLCAYVTPSILAVIRKRIACRIQSLFFLLGESKMRKCLPSAGALARYSAKMNACSDEFSNLSGNLRFQPTDAEARCRKP